MRKMHLLLLTLLMCSCGWGPIEEDKHPDWPEFPELDALGLTVEKLNVSVRRIHRGDQYVGVTDNGELMVYDHGFASPRAIGNGYTEITMAGPHRFYGIKREDGETAVVRFDGFTDSPTVIAPHPLLSNKAFIEKKQALEYQEGNRFQADRLKKYGSGYLCALEINYDLLLRYSDNEYLLDLSSTDGRYTVRPENAGVSLCDRIFKPDAVFKKCPLEDTTPYETDTQKFEWIDTATLERSSSGNHFVFGFILSGYSYYTLHLNNKKYEFKVKQQSLETQGLQLLKPLDESPKNDKADSYFFHDVRSQAIYRISEKSPK